MHPMAPAPILILEDDEPVAAALARIVAARTEALVAGTMKEARSILAKRDLAGAIVDVSLPDGNGLDAVRDIRIDRPLLPVLVLTGLSDKAIANRAQVLRAEFAYKPPDRENIRPFVERALATRAGFERAVATALDELARICELTPRERAVASMAISDLRTAHMLAILNVSRNTLKTLTRLLLLKTGDGSLADLRVGILTRAHAVSSRIIEEFGQNSPRGVIAPDPSRRGS